MREVKTGALRDVKHHLPMVINAQDQLCKGDRGRAVVRAQAGVVNERLGEIKTGALRDAEHHLPMGIDAENQLYARGAKAGRWQGRN